MQPPKKEEQKKIPINLVYLAGPIDANKTRTEWYEFLAHQLRKRNISIYNPSKGVKWAGGPEAAYSIDIINDVAISLSDFVVCFFPKDTLTIGTTVDMMAAIGYGKPLAVITDEERPMLYFSNLTVFSTFDDVLEHILSIRL